MIAFLYRLATDLGAPLIDLYLKRRLAQGREEAVRFQERLGIASLPRPNGKLVWCHAASVGEAMSLLVILEKWHAEDPSLSLLVTTGTVTSARLMVARLPSYAVHQYVPVDRRLYVRRFLDHWQPDVAVWIESELWPNLLLETKRRGIPAVLLNGRMSEKSFRYWRRFGAFAQNILGTFSLILAQTEGYATCFKELGGINVQCVGNLKYAAAPLTCDGMELDALQQAIAGRPVWLMASTHAGEEEIALAAHQALRAEFPTLLTILAPRHAVRGDAVTALIQRQGLTLARRSAQEIPTSETAIYLADTLGEMGLLYRLAPLVVMGGSWVPVGGHNPIEPAQCGAALIFGPHMDNFPEVVRAFCAADAALSVQTPKDLAPTLASFWRAPQKITTRAQNAARFVRGQSGVLEAVFVLLRPLLSSVR